MNAPDRAATVDSTSLFSLALRREWLADWQAPVPAARAAVAMSGLIGFDMRVSEPGQIVMELDPHEGLENTIGLLHGATAAALLDTAMGGAISTMPPAGQRAITLDLKLTYLRPLSVRSGRISAEGKLVKLGRQTSYAEGFVSDGAGNLDVHATATFSMIGEAPRTK